MNLITSRQGQPHVTVTQEAHLNRAMLGASSGVFDYVTPVANIVSGGVTIGEIAGLIQGRKWNVNPNTTDSVTIAAGTSGVKRYDIICIKVTQTGDTQSASWYVVQGTASASPTKPTSYATGDLDNGDSTALYGVWRVYINGLNIQSVELMANIIPSNVEAGGKVLATFTGSTIAPQDVAIDWTGYTYAEIVCDKGSSVKLQIASTDTTGAVLYVPLNASTVNVYGRRIKVTSTGLHLYDCVKITHSSSGSTAAVDNTLCLPRAVIGYKY